MDNLASRILEDRKDWRYPGDELEDYAKRKSMSKPRVEKRENKYWGIMWGVVLGENFLAFGRWDDSMGAALSIAKDVSYVLNFQIDPLRAWKDG